MKGPWFHPDTHPRKTQKTEGERIAILKEKGREEEKSNGMGGKEGGMIPDKSLSSSTTKRRRNRERRKKNVRFQSGPLSSISQVSMSPQIMRQLERKGRKERSKEK